MTIFDYFMWPVLWLCLGIALHSWRQGESYRAILFVGIGVSVLGRIHIAFLIVGMLVVLFGLFKLLRKIPQV